MTEYALCFPVDARAEFGEDMLLEGEAPRVGEFVKVWPPQNELQRSDRLFVVDCVWTCVEQLLVKGRQKACRTVELRRATDAERDEHRRLTGTT